MSHSNKLKSQVLVFEALSHALNFYVHVYVHRNLVHVHVYVHRNLVHVKGLRILVKPSCQPDLVCAISGTNVVSLAWYVSLRTYVRTYHDMNSPSGRES